MPRKAAPWYRNTAGRWYVHINGKQTPLPVTDPNDQAGAWDAFRSLVNKALQSQASRPEPIAALVPEYLESIEHRTNRKTRTGYGCYLRRFVALFGNRAVCELDPETVEKRAKEEDWSDTNRANYLWTCQALVRWAGRKDFTLRRPSKESRGADALIDESTHRLVLRETTGDFHELCRLLWATGCRPMEAARLLATDVDWASGTVTLKHHKMKHKGRKRILYLSGEAIGILKGQSDRYDGKGNLFRGIAGKPFTVHAICCRMIRVSEKIGRPVTAYGYRHSYATRALAAGIPDAHVAALMGHTSTAMVHRHYSHIGANARLLREISEKLAG